MDNLRPETVTEEPSTVGLILHSVQTPTPLIGNGVLIESFGSGASCFSHSDSRFAKASKELSKVDIAKVQPLL